MALASSSLGLLGSDRAQKRGKFLLTVAPMGGAMVAGLTCALCLSKVSSIGCELDFDD
jgi:hypothetical protein